MLEKLAPASPAERAAVPAPAKASKKSLADGTRLAILQTLCNTKSA
jgi:hypothetical protein